MSIQTAYQVYKNNCWFEGTEPMEYFAFVQLMSEKIDNLKCLPIDG